MSLGKYRCRVLKEFGNQGRVFTPGFIMWPPASVRDMWIRRGWIEIVNDVPIEESAVVAEVETATRRRGRPRKDVE